MVWKANPFGPSFFIDDGWTMIENDGKLEENPWLCIAMIFGSPDMSNCALAPKVYHGTNILDHPKNICVFSICV